MKIYVGLNTEMKQSLLLNKTNWRLFVQHVQAKVLFQKMKPLTLTPVSWSVWKKDVSYVWNCSDIFVGRTNDTGTSVFCAVRANNFI
jgi:hypothetical protein